MACLLLCNDCDVVDFGLGELIIPTFYIQLQWSVQSLHPISLGPRPNQPQHGSLLLEAVYAGLGTRLASYWLLGHFPLYMSDFNEGGYPRSRLL